VDLHRRPELAEILHEVVGEGVVVIEDEQHVSLGRGVALFRPDRREKQDKL
jgi:hypothetical protein